jgi:ribosomal protein L22
MSTSPINNLSTNYLQSVLSTALQGTGLTTKTSGNSVSSIGTSQPDQGQLSPFAQIVSALQQLQQSDPTKYQQVTQQIATNLQNAAQTAQSNGHTNAANVLNQLATDFTNASQNGQLPNMHDLAKAMIFHHHRHMQADSNADSSSASSSGTSGTSSASDPSQLLSQLLSAFQANAPQNNSLDPASIIMTALNNAGITSSNT